MPAPNAANSLDPLETLLRDGFARQKAGDLTLAEARYRAALERSPTDHRALTLLGSLLETTGRGQAAEEAYRAALAAAPDAPAPRLRLASMANAQGDGATALQLIRPFTARFPNEKQGWRLRGDAARRSGDHRDAASAYKRALDLGDAEAAGFLGQCLQKLGDGDGAARAYETAVQTDPTNATLFGALGNVYSSLGVRDKAIDCYRRAIALDPDLFEAYGALGVQLQGVGAYEEATAAYLSALERAPDRWEVLNNLASCRLDQGRPRLAQATFRELLRRNPDYLPARRNLCMAIAYDDDATPEALAAACADAADSPAVASVRPNPSHGAAPIRVGFVSADLRAHSVGAFVEPLFEHFDDRRMEIVAYAHVEKPDAVTERLKAAASLWRDTHDLDAAAQAKLIQADGVDVLIDLAGHTGDSRLEVFALRPASVQASWLGWPATTGMAAIDYKISDALLTPEGTRETFTETPINLAGPALCFRPPDAAPDVAEAPMRANGWPTFGSFNRLAKTSPRTLRLWSRILAASPAARLFLKDNAFRCPAARAHFAERLAKVGIDPARVTLEGSTATKAEHLALYGRIDVALDSVPYNGVTTTAEALWMGVPTVSLIGDTSLSRYGLSVLTHAGRPEWVAADEDAYVEIALGLVADPAALADQRKDMRATLKSTPLFDRPAFAAAFADAVEKMARGV